MRPAHALPLALCCLLVWLASGPARAGAWLRAPGDGFASMSLKIMDDDTAKTYSTFYLEYGLNPDLTGGLDIGSDETGEYKALAFVLMPLLRDELHIAFQLAAGVIDDEPALRPGISVGRGIRIFGRDGWANLDTRAIIVPKDVDLAIDATLGWTMWEETKIIWQVQHGGFVHDPDFLRAAASVVWQISPGRHIEVGATTSLSHAEDFGIQLGMWQSF
ncbi:hypothetical protein DC366_06005 [Pelagivirga sediminicola]|uniref:Transporter n=1 Tax=Pelagivirga sediminicola TaxID=2170575 RepID=A0A2T7GA40_9RHOB|nr:hypothetical protein [Pelagivirga sediminicola]PVA11292.1 hypothetical protein DC366_06005 [Pelagivirga sediminicola]